MTPIDYKEVGKRIHACRESKEWTLNDLAQRVSLSASTIQRYEKGIFDKIKLPVIESIARVLDVTPEWLIGKEDTPQNLINDITGETKAALTEEANDHKSSPIDKSTLQAAFWGGDKDLSQEDLDAMWSDVERFAAFLAEEKKRKKGDTDK